jgi:hypothetical protein
MDGPAFARYLRDFVFAQGVFAVSSFPFRATPAVPPQFGAK